MSAAQHSGKTGKRGTWKPAGDHYLTLREARQLRAVAREALKRRNGDVRDYHGMSRILRTSEANAHACPNCA
ncbi:MAG TPA: hypothetical protein VG733_05195 [Chthoniobacteraceae bacterium]|nr:hypothetical protein [Chthoniobacteraceae bacterium]